MLKILRSFLITVVFLALLTGTVSALSVPKDVSVTDRGKKTHYSTRVDTVAEFLKEAEIVLGKNDRINYALTDKVLPNYVTDIVITRSLNITITIDDVSETLNIPKGLYVGNVVQQIETRDKKDYYFEGRLADLAVDKQEFRFYSYNTMDVTDVKEVPYETIYELDDTLLKGKVEIVQKGVMGTSELITRVMFLKEDIIEEQILCETVINEPVARIIKQGAMEPIGIPVLEKTDEVAQVRDLIMNASAYTAGPESTGKKPSDKGYGITASGMRAQRGVVAVDPEVIPLGTKLFVEGYGYAIAGDTGGSIKGNKIDLFFESYDECIQFGRRNIKVTILAEE